MSKGNGGKKRLEKVGGITMGGRGSSTSNSKGMGKSDVISLAKWNNRIYVNGLTSGDDKIWLEESTTDWGSDELNKKMGGKGYGYDIKYKYKSYGYNLARDYVEHSDSELYKELDKIMNGKRRTFKELYNYAK